MRMGEVASTAPTVAPEHPDLTSQHRWIPEDQPTAVAAGAGMVARFQLANRSNGGQLAISPAVWLRAEMMPLKKSAYAVGSELNTKEIAIPSGRRIIQAAQVPSSAPA